MKTNLPKNIILIFLLFSSTLAFAQEPETVLTAPDNWRGELIPFPLGFAPEIDFKGFEDIRFAPGWSDSTKKDFWAYSFVWYIEKEEPMTEEKLADAFHLYYDGLMKVVAGADSMKEGKSFDKSLCLFIQTDKGFRGKMRVFDAFFTKDYITLNIKIKESFCDKTNKQIVVFDIAPKPFDNQVWKIFDEVKLKAVCE